MGNLNRRNRERTRYPFSPITRIASGARLRMSVQKASDVRGPGGQRTQIPHGNMRAKLLNYIGQVFECKADGLHYSCAEPRENQHVSLLSYGSFGFLVEPD